jgi:hypothetical protein
MLPWVLSSRHILRSDLLLRKIEGGKAWEELKDNLESSSGEDAKTPIPTDGYSFLLR